MEIGAVIQRMEKFVLLAKQMNVFSYKDGKKQEKEISEATQPFWE